MKNAIFCLITGFGLIACGGGGGGGNAPPPPPPPPPPTDTVTLTFENADFSEIAVRNSFEVIVQEGDQFAIEITIDRQYADLVAVTQEGIRLKVGFREDFTGDIRAQTMEGIVTIPALTGIELSNSANVILAGFTDSFLEIALSGSSSLEGANNHFDFVSAILGGSSQLQLQDISALPAAHVELSGSSEATVNVMTGGTLTGSATGFSKLFYYESSISLSVATSHSATVTRLGNTRQ